MSKTDITIQVYSVTDSRYHTWVYMQQDNGYLR